MSGYSILWSPWRAQYVKNAGKGSDKSCFICEAIKKHKDPESLVVYVNDSIVVLLNKYPYNSGHIMIAPLRHIKNLEDLTEKEWAEITKAFVNFKKALEKVFSPDGFNIGANLGRAAGAGLEDHLHFHIVPRWAGDANFMFTIGHTKVIPQSLDETLKELKKVIVELSESSKN